MAPQPPTRDNVAMTDDAPITELTQDQAWEALGRVKVGRLATSLGGQPEIFPVNYVVDERTIVFRTGQGSKLFELTANALVAFEADEWDADNGWSVVVKGTAQAVESDSEIDHLESLKLQPWVPTVKQIYVRITPAELSGRSFAFGEEPPNWF